MVHLTLVPAAARSAFASEVKRIAGLLKINPEWLMLVMKAESGVRASAVNSVSGATGLIQFMPDTARAMGTTVDALRNMGHVEQLQYVYRYYKPWAGKMRSYYDVYAVTFFPAAVGKADAWIFQTSRLSAKRIADQNPAISKGKDYINVAMFKTYVRSTVSRSFTGSLDAATVGAGAAVLIAGLAVWYFYFKNK